MKKLSSVIFHVYYGTQGTAGLYMDEIYQSLKLNGIHQKVFVSAFYPFDYGEKIYFRYSDITHGIKQRQIRMVVRYIELIYAMIVLFIRTLIERPKIVNFSLLSSLYTPEKMYLKAVRFFGLSKIMFTCHDVIPFGHLNDSVMRRRKVIFNMADYYLVHNKNSKFDLVDVFKIPVERILVHPFPVMDLNKMKYNLTRSKQYDFLFQGVLRPEKGIEILLNAWHFFHAKHPEAKLLIVGTSRENGKNYRKYEELNISFDLKYVDDMTYCSNIAKSKCIILPYKRGTNSGIPSSALSLDCEVIASDIPMFENNTLINKQFLFKSEDAKDLFRVLENAYSIPFQISSGARLSSYRQSFDYEVSEIYKKLLCCIQ